MQASTISIVESIQIRWIQIFVKILMSLRTDPGMKSRQSNRKRSRTWWRRGDRHKAFENLRP
jgi:hypothetical protein